MTDEQAERLAAAWEAVVKRAAGDPPWLRDRLEPLVEAARVTPELAALFPFTSMNRLCFSRCSDYPFTLDCPCVSVGPDGYTVQPTWAVSDEQGPPILDKTDDLVIALRAVVEFLPLDRSLWLGNRDDQH